MAITWLSKLATQIFVWGCGNAAVPEWRLPRARRILKAYIEENELNPDYLQEGIYDSLITEIVDRASVLDPSGVLRWKHLLPTIISVGKSVCDYLNNEPINDKRITDILLLNK